MYYRRKDSRMGDEIFAMGILLAPFVWKLVKKGKAVIIAKKERFDALPLQEQLRKKYKMCLIGEVIFKLLTLIRVVMLIVSIFNGSFLFNKVNSIIACAIMFVLMRVGKHKYRNSLTNISK